MQIPIATCPGCEGRLDFSQPDMTNPEALLGICHDPECRTWAIVVMGHAGWGILSASALPVPAAAA